MSVILILEDLWTFSPFTITDDLRTIWDLSDIAVLFPSLEFSRLGTLEEIWTLWTVSWGPSQVPIRFYFFLLQMTREQRDGNNFNFYKIKFDIWSDYGRRHGTVPPSTWWRQEIWRRVQEKEHTRSEDQEKENRRSEDQWSSQITGPPPPLIPTRPNLPPVSPEPQNDHLPAGVRMACMAASYRPRTTSGILTERRKQAKTRHGKPNSKQENSAVSLPCSSCREEPAHQPCSSEEVVLQSRRKRWMEEVQVGLRKSHVLLISISKFN